MLSVVSINNIPAAKSVGNIRIDQTGSPLVASPAEIPKTPISVAVSNPSPKSTPSGYMCQLLRIMLNMGRKRRPNSPRLPNNKSRSSSRYGFARANFGEGPVDGLQNDHIHGRNPKQKKGGHQGADNAPDFPYSIHAML